ncbi:SusD/RagB family nutrient-binding outer membrane lipoprotein [Niabella pedocola]|uniref:SusD/RagB family nutrient-binding outer membrane lipoprotein n=1 Tax=Niabella pedocola TaxID=1752077 RepID=A0ABS8PS97_9BACT|nr:SusD/RagB family nutrient-binding outer membrane lipoprotein [Niabella pedocola]MCD2423944.1 SusD/RagB family nutrient-binding outer membrane lipoprotein [Niabella pedocola]
MKRLIIILIGAMVCFASCKQDLSDQFKDPSKVDPPTGNLFAGMFTGMVYEWKLYVKDYGEYWWENDGNTISCYSQINHRYITSRYAWYSDYGDLVNENGFYSTESGAMSHFNAHYTRMKEWAIMRDGVEKLTGGAKDEVLVFFQLATVMKDVWALRCVDLFNKIPYFDAMKGNLGVLYPKYDDPKEIYVSILNDFKDIGASLKDNYNKMSADGKALFTKQDIALKGNIDQWVQYINALRLQYAIKLAGVDESTAKPHITEALANLPTTDLMFPTYTTDNGGGGGTWLRGVYERSFVHFMPDLLMRNMNFADSSYNAGVDDPRLPVLVMPTKYGDYRSVSMNTDSNARYYDAGDRYYTAADNIDAALSQNGKSEYSIVTFAMNAPNFPAVMITLAEVDLLRAEVAIKGYASTNKTAADYIKDAVVHSCDFWYAVNDLNKSFRPDKAVLHPVKSTGDIDTYSNKVRAKFSAQTGIENQMEVLMQQKYIHLNISNQYELFAELRRTRHPLLDPFVFNGTVMKPCPERIKYPSSELQTNQAEFLKVGADNNYTTPIFWVPANKKGVSYYR